MPGVLILCGATCTGKSALALALAERYDAEIVGADSRQIYRGMTIGTAAPSAADRARVPHHLVAFVEPHERYNAARFARDAFAALDAIHARGKRAIVVGGTGFYIRALAGDVALASAADAGLRARLSREARAHPVATLHDWLATLDPARAAVLAPTDAYRIVRALEIALAGRAPNAVASSAAEGPQPSLRARGIPFVKVVLDVPAPLLDERIERRTEAMLAAGIVAEAERIGAGAVAADAVGYPQIFAYLAGFATASELRGALARATRRYAKRQRTWFRSEPGVRWTEAAGVEAIARDVLGWSLAQDALRSDRTRS
ncbi:MAG: tRNA (adenosine(37)-N6)-dimethylallyltransferase MiaA [Vulcanimicrobiaceae bacterium]